MRRFFHFGKKIYSLPLNPLHLMYIMPISLAIGILIYFLCPYEPSLTIYAVVSFFLFSSMVWICRAKECLLFPVLIGLMAIGFLVVGAKAHMRAHDHVALDHEVHRVTLEGEVLQVEWTPKGYRLLIEAKPSPYFHATGKIRLSLQSHASVVGVGDYIRCQASLMPISGPVTPNGYDFRRQAFFQGLSATGYATGIVHVVQPDGLAYQHWVDSLRVLIRQRVMAAAQGQPAAIAVALITGERTGIDQKTNADFNDSGLAHILSISGLHFSILATLVFLLCRRALCLIPPISNHYDLKKIAAIFVIVLSFAYMLIAGGGVPVARSFIMIGCAMLAVLMDRDPISMRLVAFAATIILLFTPEALLTASFQMSFCAVIALVSYYERTGRFSIGEGRGWFVKRALMFGAGLVLTTGIATLATSPFTIFHFGRITLYAVMANGVAVPLTGILIMPAVLMSLLAMPFGLEAIPVRILEYGIELLIHIARTVAGWPHSTVTFAPLPPLAEGFFMGMFSVGFLFLCLWPSKRRLWGGLAAASSLLFLFAARPIDVISQIKPWAIMVRNGFGEAVFMGKPQPFLIGQWAMAMNVSPEKVRYLPLCDSTPWARKSGTRLQKPCLSSGKEGMYRVLDIVVQPLPNSRQGYQFGRWRQEQVQWASGQISDEKYHAFVRQKGGKLEKVSFPPPRRLWHRAHWG